MNDAYNVGFKDGASAGYKLAIEDMKLDKKPQIMKKYEGDCSTLLARHNALVEAVAWLREVDDTREWLSEFPWLRKWSGLDQCMNDARAEVDRLIADCEGEG